MAAPSSNAPKVVMLAILAGAAILAVIGTILPDLIGLTGTPALLIRLVFYGIAGIDIVVAFWLRARIEKTQSGRRDGGTVQRQ